MSPDALLAAAVTLTVPLTAGLIALGRKIGTLEALTTKELTHNGGGSMKDWTRAARDDSSAARIAAEWANQRAERLEQAVDRVERLVEQRRRQAEQAAGASQARDAKLQHDVTNVRVGQGYLVHRLDLLDAERVDRETRWAAALAAQGVQTPVPAPPAQRDPVPDELVVPGL